MHGSKLIQAGEQILVSRHAQDGTFSATNSEPPWLKGSMSSLQSSFQPWSQPPLITTAFICFQREMHRMKTSLSFSNASWFWRENKEKNEKKHKLPENWIMNLTGRERSHGFLTVTEKLKSALHFRFFFLKYSVIWSPPPFSHSHKITVIIQVC